MKLGKDKKTGSTLEIEDKKRTAHTHIVGGSGVGKTEFLFSMIKQDILNGHGVCVIDPHGGLYTKLIAWLSTNRFVTKQRKIHIFNPSDLSSSLAFNPLANATPDTISTIVDSVTSSLSHIWGGGDLTQTPLIKENLENIFHVLAENNLTIAEADFLINYSTRHIAEKLIANLTNESYKLSWEDIFNQNQRDFANNISSASRRLKPMLARNVVKNVLGQKGVTINFKNVMDRGEVVLVNLSSADTLSTEDSRIFGTLLINDMYLQAKKRVPEKSKRFYLYVDEAQNYLTSNVPNLLSETRKYGLSLILAHQYLQQLREAGDNVYSGVLSQTELKIAFGQLMHEDASILSYEIFKGNFDPHRINPATLKPTVVDHEIINLHSSSKGNTVTHTEAEARSEARAISSSDSVSSMSSYGENSGLVSGSSEMFGSDYADANLLSSPDMQAISLSNISSSTSSSASSDGSSYSNSESSSRGVSTAESKAMGVSQNEGTSESLRPIFKLYGNTYSLQEQEMMFAQALSTQQDRFAFVRTRDGQVVNIKSFDVKEYDVSSLMIGITTKQLIKGSVYLQPREQIEEAIKQRHYSLKNINVARAIKEDDYFE